jgi:hypothetical protein
MAKIQILPVDQACECPFYVKDTKGKYSCFIKRLSTIDTACALISGDGEGYDEDLWDADCGGEYAKCSVIPLLYDVSNSEFASLVEPATPEPEPEPEPVVEKKTVVKKVGRVGAADDFDPFETGMESAESQDVYVEVEEEAPDKYVATEEDVIESTVKVTAHVTANPFIVKTDVLVYPTNNMLVVDNYILDELSEGLVQEQCDRIPRPITMGNLYRTGPGTVRVRAKVIYHAVVAGESHLINEIDIAKSVRKALMMAEMEKMGIVEFLPMDRGMHDVSQAAFIVVSAIGEYLKSNETEHLKHILLVSDDEETCNLFKEYIERIILTRQKQGE